MSHLGVSLTKQKDEVEMSLTRTLLVQVEKGTITFETAQEIARYILAERGAISTEEELLLFLKTLASKWSIFETIYHMYKLGLEDEKQIAIQMKKIQEDLSLQAQ